MLILLQKGNSNNEEWKKVIIYDSYFSILEKDD
jgi:hypothetical protein